MLATWPHLQLTTNFSTHLQLTSAHCNHINDRSTIHAVTDIPRLASEPPRHRSTAPLVFVTPAAGRFALLLFQLECIVWHGVGTVR
jgi:hypothetical protein